MLAKSKLNAIEILISKTLSHSYIHKELVSINHKLKEYKEAKEEIKNPKNSVEYIR